MTAFAAPLRLGRSLTAIASVLAISACGGTEAWTPQWGPGPSDAISVSTIDESTFRGTPIIHCEGPSTELAELGTLCSATSDLVSIVSDAGDVGFTTIGQAGNQYNAIVVFGYYGDADAAVTDHASDIRYAARLVFNVGRPAPSVASAEGDVALWRTGDELTGSVATWRAASDLACYFDIFAGVAIFHWKSSTITMRFNAGWPC